MIRRFVVTAAVAAVLSGAVAACGSSSNSSGPGGVVTSPAVSCPGIEHLLHTKGVLTVATDNPVYPPWFVSNTPTNGKGYESAVAYAVARELGFAKSQVTWVHEPFNSVYAPGPKSFDFDINEVSYTAQRAQVVTFSNSYYPVQQAIIALKGSPIVTKHSPAQLKNYLYGDQIGTTGLTYINQDIQPTQQPKVFNTLNLAVAALEVHRVDALIVDTPDAQYMASSQVKHGILVAQFPTVGEHYGLVFAKGNALVACVNRALAALTSNGTLHALQKQYLGIYLHFPVIKP
jgi:polar amino acid transport system substrate-binding protein